MGHLRSRFIATNKKEAPTDEFDTLNEKCDDAINEPLDYPSLRKHIEDLTMKGIALNQTLQSMTGKKCFSHEEIEHIKSVYDECKKGLRHAERLLERRRAYMGELRSLEKMIDDRNISLSSLTPSMQGSLDVGILDRLLGGHAFTVKRIKELRLMIDEGGGKRGLQFANMTPNDLAI